MNIRKLLLAISVIFLFSCASMRDLEELSSNEVVHMWKYYKGQEVKVNLNLKSEKPNYYKPPRFVKIKVGSYFDGTSLHPRKEVLLKVEEENYKTDF